MSRHIEGAQPGVYLASMYQRRDEMCIYADILNRNGFYVTSRWLQEQEPVDSQMGDHSDEFYYQTSEDDLEDVADADFVIFFAETPETGTTRGGRHVEFGYALALNIPVIVVGPKENVFHYNDLVAHFDSFEDALAYSKERFGE